ncbi:hypothetical protein IHX65_004884 [Salmonella enterica]|nr:hypothetical protein [Salmonella enterica]
MKHCSKCLENKALYQFPKKGKYKGKQLYRNVCCECYNEFQKKYPSINTRYTPEQLKNYQLIANFGLTLETYKIMLAAQNDVCAICGETNPDGTALAVDHDHETGEIRQLLCRNCNTGIGLLKDNPELLIKASAYLMKHKPKIQG